MRFNRLGVIYKSITGRLFFFWPGKKLLLGHLKFYLGIRFKNALKVYIKVICTNSMDEIKGTKVGIYARVSTGKQEESLEEQVRILVEFCEKNNYQIYNIYAETCSGAKSERKKFIDLMCDVKRKKFNAVVVLKLDRFSRSMLDLLTSVERLKEKGVDFISVKDNIETHTAQGKLMFHLMGAFAEFERSLIYERTKVGIERAKREGKVCHRPKKKVNLDRVVDRYNKGISLTEIAVIEKVSYSTLRNRLREAKITLKAR